MKQAAIIPFFALIGTIASSLIGSTAHAQSALEQDPIKFARSYCIIAKAPGETCERDLATDRRTLVMNHYSLIVRVCGKHASTDRTRAICFKEAAIELEGRGALYDKMMDCAEDRGFWGGYVNETNAEIAQCRSNAFADRAAAVDRNTPRGRPASREAHEVSYTAN